MTERNRKIQTSYELVKKGYVAYITIDAKTVSFKEKWSYYIHDALGNPVPFGHDHDLKYTSEINIANHVGQIIDDHIDGKPISNTISRTLKTKMQSTVEEMYCEHCGTTTGHIVKQTDFPSKKAWTCVNCNNPQY
jgi:hypothetical protein